MLERSTIILVRPHPKEPLRSIFLYNDLLLNGLRERGVDCKSIGPPDFFARPLKNNSGWRRFLVYLDKQLLCPLRLRKEIRNITSSGQTVLVHILDQGDSIYTKHLKNTFHVVTCHDALGMRSALGLEPLNRRSGLLSRLFQNAILSGLKGAENVVCVSESTKSQIVELGVPSEQCRVIPNGLNHPYRPLPQGRAQQILARLFRTEGISVGQSGYIVHLGGNSWYKNRKGVILAYAHLVRLFSDPPTLILAGRPLAQELASLAENKGVLNHVFQCPDCTCEELNALYQMARFLFYPSVREGFGWPVLEAQASGGLVVTSDRAPMNVVGGTSAIYCEPPPEDGQGFEQWAQRVAKETLLPVLKMGNKERKLLIERGLHNTTRYATDSMISTYLGFYQSCIRE